MDRALQIIAEWERIGDVEKPLNMYVLGLETLPRLPSNVRQLDLFANNLTTIESLPDSIVELNISCNRSFHQLCALPPRLRRLSCSYTSLRELPDLPNTVEHLSCDNSQLTSLPSLPAALDTLFCFNNQLTSMPYLPPKLIFLLDYNNPFTFQDMRWDGRNVSDFQTDTYEQIQKWLAHTGDSDVEERKAVWEDYFAMFR